MRASCVGNLGCPAALPLLVLLVLLAVLGWPSPAWAHRDGAYWHEAEATARYPQWMLTLSPSKRLIDIALPGTHDSGTYKGNGGDAVQTQTMSIRAQLDSGIRYLDIRLRYYDLLGLRNCNGSYSSIRCELRVFHGDFAQAVLFERDVLQPVISFLRDNPSEFIMMRVARETADCDCNPGPALDDLLGKAANFDGRGAGETYADYLLDSSCHSPGILTVGAVPPLDSRPTATPCAARGKLLLLPQFLDDADKNPTLQGKHFYRTFGGLNFVTPSFDTVRTTMDLHDRLWQPVKRHLAEAGSDPLTSSAYFIGTGGALGSFPYFFASGHSSPETGAGRLSTGLVVQSNSTLFADFPRGDCVAGLCTIFFEGINTLVADYLSLPSFKGSGRRIGIVSSDFPGARLIASVANVNEDVSFDRPSFGYTLRVPSGKRYAPGAWTNGPVLINARCDVACSGTPNTVSQDTPNGVDVAMAGGGRVVAFRTLPIRIDTTPPSISAAPTTQANGNGWYRGNVAVHFSCADAGGSGLASCPPDEVLSRDGISSSSVAYATDLAGNKSSSSNIVTVKIDRTAPTVTYRGNLGAYTPGQRVDIRCEARDSRSGVASSTCTDIRGLASSFGLGVHSFSATATDAAGNAGSGSTSFRVTAVPGDVNVDGVVDCRDHAIVKASFGKRTGAVGFDPRADVNGDGLVDIRDLSFVAQRLPAGTACP